MATTIDQRHATGSGAIRRNEFQEAAARKSAQTSTRVSTATSHWSCNHSHHSANDFSTMSNHARRVLQRETIGGKAGHDMAPSGA
jgi:hypothetical protein